MHDGQVFGDLRALMGDDWVRRSLIRFRDRIDQTFCESANRSIDRDQLGRSAHRIVAASGQLGFSDFSRSCSKLEEACTDGGDVAAMFKTAQHTGQSVTDVVARLLSQIAH